MGDGHLIRSMPYRNKAKNISPTFFGIFIGGASVLAEPLFGLGPPEAYGICTICHARDLFAQISQRFLALSQNDIPLVALAAMVLTIPGIIVGSLIASLRNGEWKLLNIENPVIMLATGFVVSIAALVIMSCPTRLVLRVSYGDPFALMGLVGAILGIYIGTVCIKRGWLWF